MIELEYPSCLKEHYQKLCTLPGFVLLETSALDRGRYDILSAFPYDRLVIKENIQELLPALDLVKQALVPEDSELDLPFQGGAIGFISYDLGARLSGIQSPPLPALKDMPLLDLGLYDWAIIVDHHLKKVTLFAGHKNSSTAGLINKIMDLWHGETTINQPFKAKTDFLPLISKDTYKASFAAIHQALKQGRSYQVNLTQAFKAEYEGDVWTLYKEITQSNPSPFSCFMNTQEASILSFSPERFLLYDQGKLTTSPIKGTIHRSADSVLDEQLKKQLSECSKNRAENVMIVDLLRNDLGKIARPGSVQVSNLCTIQSYNTLHHLVSDVEAECLRQLRPFDAFLSCFPGGSITGAPKLEAMNIIREQEPYSRGVYCGSIGYFSRHGRFDTNIAIRTITAKNNSLHLGAGGGIVIDSQCEEEYRECYIKIEAIARGLYSTSSRSVAKDLSSRIPAA